MSRRGFVCFIFLSSIYIFFVPNHFLNINNSEGIASVQESCQHFWGTEL